LYELDRNDPSEYLPDHRLQNYALFDPHRLAIMEKITFSYLMGALGLPQPRTFAFVRGGRLIPLASEWIPGSSGVDIHALLEIASKVVLRPVGAFGGRGVFSVSRTSAGYLINREHCSRQDVERRIAALDEYVITEFVTPGDFATAIDPNRPSTARLLTLWDIERGTPFLAAATYRFASTDSGFADSFTVGSGGLVAEINFETGVLGTGINLDPAGSLLRLATHPRSNARIEGVAVPHWSDTVEVVLAAAAALPQFPLIGWDLIIANDGPRLLEGNSPPGIQVWQVHTPLLRDPRSRAFFEWVGAV
jgi:hypothetical protein